MEVEVTTEVAGDAERAAAVMEVVAGAGGHRDGGARDFQRGKLLRFDAEGCQVTG